MNLYMSRFKQKYNFLLPFLFLSPFLLLTLSSSPIHATTHKHSKSRTHKKTTSKKKKTNVILGKVILTQRPNTSLEALARKLNQNDIAFSAQHSDQPVILIGYSNLSSTKTVRNILFTQLQSATLCGSAGCSTTAYVKRNNRWLKVVDAVTGDIEIKKTTHKGMHDLLVSSSDLWVWNGKTYVESQAGPSVHGLKQSIREHQQQNK